MHRGRLAGFPIHATLHRCHRRRSGKLQAVANAWETYEVTESGSSGVRLATWRSVRYGPAPPSRIRVGFRFREYWLELLPHPRQAAGVLNATTAAPACTGTAVVVPAPYWAALPGLERVLARLAAHRDPPGLGEGIDVRLRSAMAGSGAR